MAFKMNYKGFPKEDSPLNKGKESGEHGANSELMTPKPAQEIVTAKEKKANEERPLARFYLERGLDPKSGTVDPTKKDLNKSLKTK